MFLWLGAFLIICSILYAANETLKRKRLSGRAHARESGTLEPRSQRLTFLGLGRNWPGLVLFVVGVALLILGAAFQTDLPG